MTATVLAVAPAQTGQSSSTSSPVLRTAQLRIRERTAFGGRVWKSKGVVLDNNQLTIHQPSSSRQTRVPLGSITELERTDLTDYSLAIKCGRKTYHLAFDSDSDLYDWRDDMYARSPLGARTTNPFDFKHTAHIGANGVTGTFAEPSTLPMYEEMIGRSISTTNATPAPFSTSVSAATPALASRSRSGQSGSARRRSNPLKGTIILNNNNNINIEGAYFIKQTGMFAGWYWKERWLSLKGSHLTVHTRKTKASPPAKEIPVSTITSVEPDIKRSNCLFVATTSRETCLYILFPTDADLYAWREAIYLRSGVSAVIGNPTNFVHGMHVTYDETTGELKGLPDQWKSVLDPALFKQSSTPAHLTNKLSKRRSANNSSNSNANNGNSRSSRPRPDGAIHVPLPTSGHRRVLLSSSADTEASSVLGRSPGSLSSPFVGTSVGSDNTLLNPGSPVFASVEDGKKR